MSGCQYSLFIPCESEKIKGLYRNIKRNDMLDNILSNIMQLSINSAHARNTKKDQAGKATLCTPHGVTSHNDTFTPQTLLNKKGLIISIVDKV